MKKKLPHAFTILLIVYNQACKKKEENPEPQVTQIGEIELTTEQFSDLTDGKSYDAFAAVENKANINIAYYKSLLVANNGKDTTLKSLIASPSALLLDGTTSPFTNVTSFAPLSQGPFLTTVEDANELKSLYDQAVSDFGGSSSVLSGIPAGIIIMFKARGNTDTPKYGGIQFNSFNADSSKVNVSITIQK